MSAETPPAALDRVYQLLSARTASAAAAAPVPAAAPLLTAIEPPQHDQIGEGVAQLQQLFALSSFECDVLLLCAGVALEARFAAACGAAHGDPRAGWPTWGLALSALPQAHWSAISRARPLRYWRLIELGGSNLMQAPIQIDERILQFLLGIPALDERLESLFRPLSSPVELRRPYQSPQLTRCLQSAVRHWQHADALPQPLLLQATQSSMRRAAFLELCEACDCRPYTLRAAELPTQAVEREQLARLWTREAALTRAALYIHCDADGSELPGSAGPLSCWLQQLRARVALDALPASSAEQLHALRVELPCLTAAERKQIWQNQLGTLGPRLDHELERVAEYFHFDQAGIELSASTVLQSITDAPQDAGTLTWQVCRRHARRALESLARRIEPRASWNDLVLPPAQMQILHQIGVHMRQRALVNEGWGFSSRYSRGLGLCALFAGGSGTGKTMAAEILAAELDLDLYQIDLAGVVSKYIGETEKNLRRIFDAAEESGAVLLFDEADALFGKRSEVRDSHDRYANLEVSYLLQRIDSYRGMALLTTNMRHALDPAFLRRIHFIVQFPFPDAPSRSRIWQGIFPAAAPRNGLDFERLSQLNVSGGVIRNIAMHAAFLAADEGSAIGTEQLLAAARIEYAKLDKPLTAAESKGWA
jgi:hypothetical protein